MKKQVIITNPESTRINHKYAKNTYLTNINYISSYLLAFLQHHFSSLNNIDLTAVGTSNLFACPTHEKDFLLTLLAYHHAVDGLAGLLLTALFAFEVIMSC